MTFYHGNNQKDFQINPHKNSRYGFPVLFFTPNIELAKLYAVHHYRNDSAFFGNGGSIHKIELSTELCDFVNWQNLSSHNSDFRKRIFNGMKERSRALFFENVIDYPSKELRFLSISDILAVYDFQLIDSIELVETNITHA